MKITLRQLRETVREVLAEMPYMRPHHMRGVGPEIDLDAKRTEYGAMQLSSEQMLLKYPEATRAFVQAMRRHVQRHGGVYGAQQWSPKEIMDMFVFYEELSGSEPYLSAESTDEYDELMGSIGDFYDWDAASKTWGI